MSMTCEEFADIFHQKTGKTMLELSESKDKKSDLPRVVDWF